MRALTPLITSVLLACSAVAQSPHAQAVAARDSKGITDVPGIRVGHFTLAERPTGCTVILSDSIGAIPGISQRGGAPGTRETSLLDPANAIERIDAMTLRGGSTV